MQQKDIVAFFNTLKLKAVHMTPMFSHIFVWEKEHWNPICHNCQISFTLEVQSLPVLGHTSKSDNSSVPNTSIDCFKAAFRWWTGK